MKTDYTTFLFKSINIISIFFFLSLVKIYVIIIIIKLNIAQICLYKVANKILILETWSLFSLYKKNKIYKIDFFGETTNCATNKQIRYYSIKNSMIKTKYYVQQNTDDTQ